MASHNARHLDALKELSLKKKFVAATYAALELTLVLAGIIVAIPFFI